MLFKDVLGQNQLKKRLLKTVSNGRISHAQLFLGKNGFGSLPLALAYVQYINCTNKQEEDSCGNCNSCLKMGKLIHPDLHFSYPVNTNKEVKSNASSNSFLEAWRSINKETPYFNLDDWHRKIDIEQKQSIINVQESQGIIKKLSLKPFEGTYKFLILFKAENLNVQASNKLLKLIEEPTDKTIIILIAEEEEQLLKTITSRTQLVRVPPIEQPIIKRHLIEEFKVEERQAESISALSEGDFIEAMSRLSLGEEEEMFFDLFKTWMRACYEANIERMYNWVEEISARSFGREKQKRFLDYALLIMREGTIRNYGSAGLQRFRGSKDDFMKRFAPFVNGKNIIDIVNLLTEAHQQISRNAYAKILFMDMSMKFANLLRIKASN